MFLFGNDALRYSMELLGVIVLFACLCRGAAPPVQLTISPNRVNVDAPLDNPVVTITCNFSHQGDIPYVEWMIIRKKNKIGEAYFTKALLHVKNLDIPALNDQYSERLSRARASVSGRISVLKPDLSVLKLTLKTEQLLQADEGAYQCEIVYGLESETAKYDIKYLEIKGTNPNNERCTTDAPDNDDNDNDDNNKPTDGPDTGIGDSDAMKPTVTERPGACIEHDGNYSTVVVLATMTTILWVVVIGGVVALVLRRYKKRERTAAVRQRSSKFHATISDVVTSAYNYTPHLSSGLSGDSVPIPVSNHIDNVDSSGYLKVDDSYSNQGSRLVSYQRDHIDENGYTRPESHASTPEHMANPRDHTNSKGCSRPNARSDLSYTKGRVGDKEKINRLTNGRVVLDLSGKTTAFTTADDNDEYVDVNGYIEPANSTDKDDMLGDIDRNGYVMPASSGTKRREEDRMIGSNGSVSIKRGVTSALHKLNLRPLRSRPKNGNNGCLEPAKSDSTQRLELAGTCPTVGNIDEDGYLKPKTSNRADYLELGDGELMDKDVYTEPNASRAEHPPINEGMVPISGCSENNGYLTPIA